MMEFIEVAFDKFIFRIAPDRRYTESEIWAQRVGTRVRIGVTDFQQQRSGDVAFVNLKPVGTPLVENDELGTIETIKVDLVLPCPISGTLAAVNDELVDHPERLNSDPYGEGWLAEIEPREASAFDRLLRPEDYRISMLSHAGGR